MEDWENKFLYEKVIAQTQEMFNFKVFDDLRNASPVNHLMYLKNFKTEQVDILLNQSNVIKRLRERQLVQQKALLHKAREILAGLVSEYHSQYYKEQIGIFFRKIKTNSFPREYSESC